MEFRAFFSNDTASAFSTGHTNKGRQKNSAASFQCRRFVSANAVSAEVNHQATSGDTVGHFDVRFERVFVAAGTAVFAFTSTDASESCVFPAFRRVRMAR